MRSFRKVQFVCAFTLLATCPLALAEDPVLFADANLKAAVEAALGVDDPTPSDMLALVTLDAGRRNIEDLSGLEYAVNLTELLLPENPISSISPISGLTKLKHLNLNGYNKSGNIADIAPLSAMTELETLEMRFNLVSDITPLANLTRLTLVNMQRNLINSIPDLSLLTNLTELDLSDNSITDVNPLSALTNLQRLMMSGNRISDITPLSVLTNLEKLELAANQISDISPLYDEQTGIGLTRLGKLALDYNRITDISPVRNLTNLGKLHLPNNQIVDISPVAGLTNLFVLDLRHNQIIDIEALADLVNIGDGNLGLSYNQIVDIAPLSGVGANWTVLDMQSNQIVDIAPLAYLTNLTQLNLRDNQISEVSPLRSATTLTLLHLGVNPLSWEAYCLDIPVIQMNNPGVNVVVDPNPFNCDCEPTYTPEGLAVTITPTDSTTGTTPVGITFEQVTISGGTMLTTSDTGPTPPATFQLGDPSMYYEIATTASYAGWIEVCISYAGVSFAGPEELLRLYHYDSGAWVDCTTQVDTATDVICGSAYSLSPFAILVPSIIHVDIDIKPGSYPNSVNINGNGLIPVAILGNAEFDIQWIDVTSLNLAGLMVRVKNNGTPQCSVEDVDKDGYADLVCQFVDDTSSWVEGTTMATLTGNLKSEFGATPIKGSDEIRVVP